MRDEYDFSQSTPNTYTKNLKNRSPSAQKKKSSITSKLYPAKQASPTKPCNLYLQDCAKAQRKPSLEWA
jgi:hypothetical protein